MNNVGEIKDCYGCGICGVVCAKQIIEIHLNHDGFYEPSVKNIQACTQCGLCLECCAYVHADLSLKRGEVQSYAAWSNREKIRQKCSSGGIGYEIGEKLIKQGYKACGVRYNTEKQRAEHFIATTPQEYIPSIGSKYIQSYTLEAFKAINRKEKYLIAGTPCQIDSFRRYIRKFKVEKHFILLDFFCHGVPSMYVWTKYLKEIEEKSGQTSYVSWRNKFVGWIGDQSLERNDIPEVEKNKWAESYRIYIRGNKGYYISNQSGKDNFYSLFLSNICLGKACYEKCKYKYINSSADIRIGDLWGTVYRENEEGVNALLTFTAKGREIVESLENCTVQSHPLAIVTEGQLKNNIKTPFLRRKALSLLQQENIPLTKVVQLANKQKWINVMKYRVQHPGYVLKQIKKRIKR